MMGIVNVYGSKFAAECGKTRMEYISRYWLRDSLDDDETEQKAVNASDCEWFYASADHYSIHEDEFKFPEKQTKRLTLEDVYESI